MSDSQPKLVGYDVRFLDASYDWLQDAEFRRLNRAALVTREQQQMWFLSLPGRTDYLIRGVELDGRPIGACGLKHVTASDAEYWGFIGVADMRGRGIGRWILESCLAWARELQLTSVWLRVGLDNRVAIGLYRKLGFVNVEQTAEDLVMRRALG